MHVRATAVALGLSRQPQKMDERYNRDAAVNYRSDRERLQTQITLCMAQGDDQREHGTGEQLAVNQSPNLTPDGNRTADERISFWNPETQHIIRKQSVKDLQQQIEREMCRDAGKHKRAHRR